MFSKSRFLLGVCGFFAFFLAMALPYPPVSAQEMAKTTDKYDFYSGGIHFLTADLTTQKGKNSYNALFAAAPHGFLGKLLPWTAKITVDGAIKDGKLTPKEFVNLTAWKQVPKTATLQYDSKGKLIKFIENTPKRGIVEKDIEEKNAAGTVDVLTAVLKTMSTSLENTCHNSYPVFDGKRRFNITIKDPKDIVLEKTKYNSFAGKAVQCTLDVEPIAGFKEKKSGWASVDADENKKQAQPTIWFGLDEKTNKVKLVKIQLKTDHGMVIAHLANK